MLSSLFAFGFLFSGLAFLFFVLRSFLVREGRKAARRYSALSMVLMVAAFAGFGVATDQEARDEGFLGSGDRRDAKEAGYTDPEAWASIREARLADLRTANEAAAAAQAQLDMEVGELVTFVTEATQQLPGFFRDHGSLIPESARMQPLAPDVLAYARFYWAIDVIEGNCRHLGQRTNIEILDPTTGIKSWVDTASGSAAHPDHKEYLSINERFTSAVDELSEATVCAAMYGLLGPDGSLMEDALAINNLIDPELIHLWRVKQGDGVLWSSKDYCDRRYYLEQQNQPPLHEAACEEAKVQSF